MRVVGAGCTYLKPADAAPRSDRARERRGEPAGASLGRTTDRELLPAGLIAESEEGRCGPGRKPAQVKGGVEAGSWSGSRPG
jgi:hypothetical protein